MKWGKMCTEISLSVGGSDGGDGGDEGCRLQVAGLNH